MYYTEAVVVTDHTVGEGKTPIGEQWDSMGAAAWLVVGVVVCMVFDAFILAAVFTDLI